MWAINKKTGELVVVEVKPLTGNGIKLSPGKLDTGLPPQMTDKWIAHVYDRLPEGPAKSALEKTFDGSKYNVQKTVIGVNSGEVKLVVIK